MYRKPRKHPKPPLYVSKAYRAYVKRLFKKHTGTIPVLHDGEKLEQAIDVWFMGTTISEHLYVSMNRQGFARRFLADDKEESKRDDVRLKAESEVRQAKHKATRAAYKAELKPYMRKSEYSHLVVL
jgi:hypothetical protein